MSAVPAENTAAIADAFYADAMCSDIGLVLMHLCLFPSVLLTILVDWLEIQQGPVTILPTLPLQNLSHSKYLPFYSPLSLCPVSSHSRLF